MNHPLVALLAVLKDTPDALMLALLLAFLCYLATLATTSVRRGANQPPVSSCHASTRRRSRGASKKRRRNRAASKKH